MKWKENHDNDYYIKCFKEQVLDKLDQLEVIDELYALLPEKEQFLLYITNCPPWSNDNINIALVCYEKPSDFCHRQLVSDWLNEIPVVTCKEWEQN